MKIVCLATSVGLAFEPKRPVWHTITNAVSTYSAKLNNICIVNMALSKFSRYRILVDYRVLNEDDILPRDFLKFYLETFRKVRAKTGSVLLFLGLYNEEDHMTKLSVAYKLAYRYRL